jgi:hypothetical protein
MDTWFITLGLICLIAGVFVLGHLFRQSSREARCDRQVSRVHNLVGWAVLDAWGGGIG